MGIDPELFGPYIWGAMHLIALGAPENIETLHIGAYKAFYNHLPHLIPCASCSKHLQENLDKLPIDDALKGSKTLFAWTVALHNIVNKQLGKPEVSVDAARAYWLNAKIAKPSASASPSVTSITNEKITSLALTAVIAALVGGGVCFALLRTWNRRR